MSRALQAKTSRVLKDDGDVGMSADTGLRRSAKPPEDRHFVTALARGLEVLSCFRTGRRLLGNYEIAQRCGLPKSTVSRLTMTLVRQGYLAQDAESGKFRLGDAMLALGSTAVAQADLGQAARPLMQALADESHGMVSLAIRNRTSMVYVEVCRSELALNSSLTVGSRLPIVTSAIGRAYLAGAGNEEREEILALVRERKAELWAPAVAAVERALTDYQALGCTTSFGHWQRGVNAIAAPVVTARGQVMGAINCGGPVSELSQGYLLNVVRPRLLRLLAQLRERLG
ncbi:IclR family transcriptional regulator [Verticiella alkaliphila]|uniref:IclR family transcriptional regulator n=1 Tax=Verticiella alkaliphila TaxID=2779529 RepID=UPI0035303CB6